MTASFDPRGPRFRALICALIFRTCASACGMSAARTGLTNRPAGAKDSAGRVFPACATDANSVSSERPNTISALASPSKVPRGRLNLVDSRWITGFDRCYGRKPWSHVVPWSSGSSALWRFDRDSTPCDWRRQAARVAWSSPPPRERDGLNLSARRRALGREATRHSEKLVQGYVHALRKQLGPDLLETQAPGVPAQARLPRSRPLRLRAPHATGSGSRPRRVRRATSTGAPALARTAPRGRRSRRACAPSACTHQRAAADDPDRVHRRRARTETTRAR